MNKSLSVTVIAAISFLTASGVPAKPGITVYTQPDGTTINTRLAGDEFGHRYFAEDGYPLTESGGTLFYASLSESGDLTRSEFRAVNITDRSAECTLYLESLDKQILRETAGRILATDRIRSAKTRRTHFNRHRQAGRAYESGFGLFPDASYPRTGSPRSLVILVEFQDITFQDSYNPLEYFSEMLTQRGFDRLGATGSALDYFIDASHGAFTPEFDVVGPVKLPQLSMVYGANDENGNDINPARMVADACIALDPSVDFSQYDCDGDGLIDNIFIFYAGRGEASGGAPTTIWPHSWDVRYGVDSPVILDGKTLAKYACSNEWDGSRPDGIGTFVHEFSHVLGLPDLYATSYTDAFTPGQFSVMDQGSYNNTSRTPPCYSTFERYALGWSKGINVSGTRQATLPPADINDGMILSTPSDSEIYFIENRQQQGWDAYLPGHGMLIWHVNYDEGVWFGNTVNNNPERQYADLIEADRITDSSSRCGDPFPGTSGVTSVTFESHPALKCWQTTDYKFSIRNIRESEGNIYCDITAPGNSPFAGQTPVALEATDIHGHGFTANWTTLESATDYILSVEEMTDSGASVMHQGFDNGAVLSSGWTVTPLLVNNNSSYAGESAPSLMFFMNTSIIETPKTTDAISKVDLWYMAIGKNGPTSPSLLLWGWNGHNWETIKQVQLPAESKGKTVSIETDSQKYKALRFLVTGAAGMTLYIDDIRLYHGMEDKYSMLDTYPLHVGNTDCIFVNGLKPDTEYRYYVQATDGEYTSSASRPATVRTGSGSGMKTPMSPDSYRVFRDCDGIRIESNLTGKAQLYSTDGKLIWQGVMTIDGGAAASLKIPLTSHGLYILKTGDGTDKIVY